MFITALFNFRINYKNLITENLNKSVKLDNDFNKLNENNMENVNNMNSIVDDCNYWLLYRKIRKIKEKCLLKLSIIYKFFISSNSNDYSGKETQSANNSDILCLLNGIRFRVYENKIFNMLGHNGTGKSTLINIIVGLINPSKGSIYYSEEDFSNKKSSILEQFGYNFYF